MSTYTDASLIITPNAKKAGKLYALKGADLDVVRATTATYVGSDGLIKTALANEVRFDYTNGSCPSILVEPQRTNLILRSEEFANAYWSKNNSTILPNVETSPNGTMSADKMYPSSSGLVRGIFIANNPLNTYNFSIYAKAGGKNFLYFYVIGSSANTGVWFNLSAGTIGTIGSAWSNVVIQNAGNGWYRCSANVTLSNAANNLYYFVSDTNNSLDVTANGTDGLFLWGAQLEAGSNATSYIPTTTSTVTRNADVISKTGISSLIGQTEGTLYWEGRLQGQSFSDGVARILLSISDGTTNNRIEIYRINNVIQYDNVVGGAIQFSGTVFTITDFTGQPLKLAITYTLNNVKVFINGVLVNTDTTALIPACSQINIGSNRLGGSQPSGLIKNTLLFKTQLTDAEAIQLTTL